MIWLLLEAVKEKPDCLYLINAANSKFTPREIKAVIDEINNLIALFDQ